MMTHKEAAFKFSRCKNKEKGYKLYVNTWLQKLGNAFVVKLHDTNVVIIRPDGKYRINSGRWRTATTKKRISYILPKPVYQSRGLWYVDGIPYYDKMLIGSDGTPIGPHKTPNNSNIRTKGIRR